MVGNKEIYSKGNKKICICKYIMVYNVNGVKEIIMKQTEQSTDLFPQGGQGGLL